MGAKKLSFHRQELVFLNQRKRKKKLRLREIWKKLRNPLLRAVLGILSIIPAVLGQRIVREIAPGRFEELKNENKVSEYRLRGL